MCSKPYIQVIYEHEMYLRCWPSSFPIANPYLLVLFQYILCLFYWLIRYKCVYILIMTTIIQNGRNFSQKSFFPDQFKKSKTFPWPDKSMLVLLIVRYGNIKKKSISNFKISTCPASQSASQDSRMFGISVLCNNY